MRTNHLRTVARACEAALCALVVVVVTAGSTLPVAAATFEVTTTADSGAGSLRQAIGDANGSAGVDAVEFTIPEGQCSAAGVCIISLLTALPALTEGAVIDGATQPRYGAAPSHVCATAGDPSYMRVLLSGPADVILQVSATEPSTIRGLAFAGSDATAGIYISTYAVTRVQCNHFGLNGQGTVGTDLSIGVCLACGGGGGNAIVGTDGDGVDDGAERNVFGTVGFAIYVNAGDENQPNVIAGNYLGFGADGRTPMNLSTGVFMRQDAAQNLVGSNLDMISDDLERNVIGNCTTGVWSAPSSDQTNVNHIVGNWIGLDGQGMPAPNEVGIRLDGDSPGQDVRRNQVLNNWSGILIRSGASIDDVSGYNCFAHNTAGLRHEGLAVAVFAEDNYWNAFDGPSGVGAGSGDAIEVTGSGSVDFDPWLTWPGAICPFVFTDGFESGGISRWSQTVP